MKNILFLSIMFVLFFSCSKESSNPTQVSITGVTLNSFPVTESNGASWDLTSGPDIYFQIYQGSTLVYEHPTYFENINTAQSFTLATPIDLIPSNEYIFQLMDYDNLDDDDWMGGISFYPYSEGSGTPKTKTLAPGDISVTFSLSYQF